VEAPRYAGDAGIPAATFLAAGLFLYPRKTAIFSIFGVADVAVWFRKLGGGGRRGCICCVEAPRRIAYVGFPAASSERADVLRDSRMSAVQSLLR